MPSITTAVKRLLRLTSRHLGGGDGTSLPLVSACHRERYWGSESTTPTARPLPRPPPAPSRGGGQCMAIGRIPCTGRKRDFMEFSVRPIRACLLQGTVSMGNRPRGGGARRGEGGTSPAPVPTCHRERFSMRAVDHPRRPAAAAASSRPLPRGRAVHGDSPDSRARGTETGSQGVSGETAK